MLYKEWRSLKMTIKGFSSFLLCNKASTASLQKLLRSLGTRKHTAILLYSVMQTLCLLQVKMFQRETQTVVTRNQYQQVMEDAATQMV